MPPLRTVVVSQVFRTVVVPHSAGPELYRVLLEVRSAVNSLVVDWMSHPAESRLDASRRSFLDLRARYPHLDAGWCTTITTETLAVLNAWDRSLRRARRQDLQRFDRMVRSVPRRKRLKAGLRSSLFALRNGQLRIRLHQDRQVIIDLTHVQNPLFAKYGMASRWTFGLTVTPTRLLFHFRIPHEVHEASGVAGIDLNFEQAVIACSDGTARAIDLTPVLRIQSRMARKRASVARNISKDQRHQKMVLRRYGRRERRRTDAALHQISNDLVRTIGDRAVVIEDLTDVTHDALHRDLRSPESRDRLSRWTHGRLVSMFSYKLNTPMVRVNPEGTSRECPRCGGHTAPPREERAFVSRATRQPSRMSRRTTCEACGAEWHRDVAAAIAVLARGFSFLRGATVPQSARDALLKAAEWRSIDGRLWGPIAEPVKGDDAIPEPLGKPEPHSDRL